MTTPPQLSGQILKLPNPTSTPTKPILIIDLTQDEDSDQDSKEDFINNFIQRRDEIIKKITTISQQTDNEEKRISELRRLIFTKPRIQEAICVKNLLKNTASDFNKQILQDLTNDIGLSFKCLLDLRNFYLAQKSLLQAEKYIQTSRMIESTWQQIYKLPIYDSVLVSQISKVEWIFRSFEVLNHSRTDDSYPFIEYCETLKSGALVSQSEKLIESKYFQKIQEETQRYQDLIQESKFLLKQEGNLVAAQKMDAQQAQELLKQLKDFGFGMKQEVENIEGVLKKALSIGAKFSEFLQKKAVISTNDLLELLHEIRNFPVRFTKIEETLTKILNDQNEQVKIVLQETAERIRGENREIHQKFVKCTGTMIPKSGHEVQKITKYSEELMLGLHLFDFQDFCRTRRQITEKGYEYIKGELWLAQMRILGIYCESLIKPSNSITFEELQSFLPEIKDYVNSLPHQKRAPFDKQIDFLQRLICEIKVWIGEERDKQGISDKVFYGFIDVTTEMARSAGKQQESENLNGKRNRFDYLIREIDEYEDIEKKIKRQNVIHQPEKVKIEELDKK